MLTVPCMNSDLICDYIAGIHYTACKQKKFHMKFAVIDQNFTSTSYLVCMLYADNLTTIYAANNP